MARHTTLGRTRPRLLAFVREHNSHGLCYDTLYFLPEGDAPDYPDMRAPWLDEPKEDDQ